MPKPLQVHIKLTDPNATVPSYATAHSAGADLYLCAESDLTVSPGETVLAHTGVSMEIPEGYVGLIFARSGLATKRHLAPANKVGVIDSDYRGEIMVPVHNHGQETQTVRPGERIAQMVFLEYGKADFVCLDELNETDRGTGGFGSTGTV
ncbi:MAG: dUTP diphosphatase [Clostridia bacterium]|nr:dUTP diphosphatase [Clostridia bacterium]